MSALLNDIALPHDDDLVGIDDRAQTMSDDDHSLLLLLKQGVQSLLHLMLAFSIESTRSLVQKKDARLTNQGTSDGNALFLATREAHASLTDLCVEAFWEENLVVEEAAASLAQSQLHALIHLSISEL